MTSINGDYIGAESCFDLINHHQFNNISTVTDPGRDRKRNINVNGDDQLCKRVSPSSSSSLATRLTEKIKTEFPPPLPFLVRTKSLNRHYTSDGRLILTLNKVRHHEYFRAHRSNGRLMLELVAVDIDDEDDDVEDVADGQYSCSGDDESETASHNNSNGNGEQQSNSPRIGKCLNRDYNVRGRGSPCLLGGPVPAMRPVRI